MVCNDSGCFDNKCGTIERKLVFVLPTMIAVTLLN